MSGFCKESKKIGGPEREEFELRLNSLLRLFLWTRRLLRCISESRRKRFISTSSASGLRQGTSLSGAELETSVKQSAVCSRKML